MRGRLGDEADATRLVRTDLEVGEGGRRHEVDAALVVGELDELGVALERGRDDLLDLGRGLRRLEGELAGAVGDTDANVHASKIRDAVGAPCAGSLRAAPS